jgi:heat shock protein HslJ
MCVAAVVIVGAGGCGDDSSSDAGASLNGRRFVSVSVSEDGRPRPLVAGTHITLNFDDGRLGANAGCNTMGTAIDVTDGTIASNGEIASTAMGCADALMAQDEWLGRLLREPLKWRLDGDRLELWNDTTNIVLRES